MPAVATSPSPQPQFLPRTPTSALSALLCRVSSPLPAPSFPSSRSPASGGHSSSHKHSNPRHPSKMMAGAAATLLPHPQSRQRLAPSILHSDSPCRKTPTWLNQRQPEWQGRASLRSGLPSLAAMGPAAAAIMMVMVLVLVMGVAMGVLPRTTLRMLTFRHRLPSCLRSPPLISLPRRWRLLCWAPQPPRARQSLEQSRLWGRVAALRLLLMSAATSPCWRSCSAAQAHRHKTSHNHDHKHNHSHKQSR